MARTWPYANGTASQVYTVQASDDLGQRAVTVADRYGRRMWTKTRELVGEEIVESIVDASSYLAWTIHKPKRGYYLILRSPLLPSASSFISLRPSATPTQPDRFTFALRSNLVPPPMNGRAHGTAVEPSTAAASSSSRGVKRRSVTISSPRVPGPLSSTVPDGSDDPEPTTPTTPRASQFHESPPSVSSAEPATFVLAPASPSRSEKRGVFATAMAKLTSVFADPSHSFVCYSQGTPHRRAASSSMATPASPTISVVSSTPSSSPGSPSVLRLTATATDETPDEDRIVVKFTDETSAWTPAGTRGKLEVSDRAAEESRMPLGFWVAVALAYLEFREDKEAYMAASVDVQ